MTIDYRIPLQAQSFDMLGMLGRGSELAQFYTKQKTDNEMTRIYNESQGDLDKMLSIAPQSKMARWVMPQLQSQKADQEKAMYDRLKTEAEISKIGSEAYKNNQQGGGHALDNSGKKLGAINGAIQQVALTGDKTQALLALHGANRAGAITPEDLEYQSKIINAMTPDELKQYASGIVFSNSKDPSSIMYQSANNVADNATSLANNQNTVNATLAGQQVQKEIADANRVSNDAYRMQQLHMQQNKGQIVNAADGKSYIFYPGLNKYEPMLDQNGQHVAKTSSAGKMTEQESKDALFGARMQESNKIINNLEREGVKPPVLSNMPIVGNFANALPQIMGGASPQQQQYMQAQRDFINALLRKESGAVIGQDEFESAQKQYFPQIGDSAVVISQKAKNRELAMKMIVGSAGEIGGQKINQATGIPYANAGSQVQSTFNLFD